MADDLASEDNRGTKIGTKTEPCTTKKSGGEKAASLFLCIEMHQDALHCKPVGVTGLQPISLNLVVTKRSATLHKTAVQNPVQMAKHTLIWPRIPDLPNSRTVGRICLRM